MKNTLLIAFALMISVGLTGCGNDDVSKTEKTGVQALKEQQSDVSDFKGIPSWAKDLGALEPKGLTLDSEISTIIEENAEEGMNKSFSAHYNGKPDILMSEAKRLVKALNGTITDEEEDYLLADGNFPGELVLSIVVRTDTEEPFLDYSIFGMKKFE